MVTLVIPSRNNLKYVKTAYESIRIQLGQDIEVILLDDASTDGTWEWMKLQALQTLKTKIYRNEGPERVGHTVLYDVGADMATNEVFGIFHADMIATPNYIKNMMKNLKPRTVISATRIEPPLHPPGPEKYVQNFGMEPETFNEAEFLYYVQDKENSEANKDKTTKGIFAPWIMYVADFKAIGGHDKRVFAPMELEDSDLFNRFLLNGYELIQARDAFVYHMTCRGSRFKDGIKIVQQIPVGNGNIWNRSQDSDEYTALRNIKFKEWWRKWHMDVLHDENMLPIVHPRYDTGFVIKNVSSKEQIIALEPWCDKLYIGWSDAGIEPVARMIQETSKFNIEGKIRNIADAGNDDITITFDMNHVHQGLFDIIKQLPPMIKDSGEIGRMEYDIFTIDIKRIIPMEKQLIHADDLWYLSKLK